jgi:hypothetical protein
MIIVCVSRLALRYHEWAKTAGAAALAIIFSVIGYSLTSIFKA